LSLRFQADNDLKFSIVKAARQREPSIDFLSAQESQLHGMDDAELLERVAEDGRVLVSHDRRTMLRHFHDRLMAAKSSPGLLVVSQGTPIRDVVEAILVLRARRFGRIARSGLSLAVPHAPRVRSLNVC
jgi:Domain of unknown function (DUF5615)